MKWLRKIINWIKKVLLMNKLPINEATGLIDEDKVKNVCLCYDGAVFYFTAIVNGVFVYIKYSVNLENWFKSSNIPISRFCDIWEMEVPPNANILELQDIPSSVKKAKFGSN